MAVGVCEIDNNRNIVKLHRAPSWQGWVFKDVDAFEHHADMPCYVPELFDTVYTRSDILELCDGQEKIADKIFYQLDWQSPATLFDEELRDGELTICRECNRLFESYQTNECPHCGFNQVSD